ncbi:MAG: ABC transporter permease [Acidobacteria bacterium]|nr:ABC transporter permease [Acidobacteriota bacterium]
MARSKGVVKAALITLGVLVAMVAVLPLFIPYPPDAIDLAGRRAAPSLAHWLGTDDLGRDLFSRALHGGRVSLAIGVLAAAVATMLGGALGATSGYFGGAADSLLMRMTDTMLSVPRLLLLMIVAAILQPSVLALILLIGAVGWMETARVTRTAVRSLATQEFVLAARAAGASNARILTRHLLANATAPLRASAALAVARAILLESTLSFFGVGVQPPAASWGSMLYQAQATMTTEPWLAVAPGAFILASVMAVTVLTDAERY